VFNALWIAMHEEQVAWVQLKALFNPGGEFCWRPAQAPEISPIRLDSANHTLGSEQPR
jgi:hypothetical protein